MNFKDCKFPRMEKILLGITERRMKHQHCQTVRKIFEKNATDELCEFCNCTNCQSN